MTNNELIEAVAKEIMEWHKKDSQYWIIEPSTAQYPDVSMVNTEYFTMMVAPGINPFWMPQGSQFFDPIANANHWVKVIERMKNLGYYVCIDASDKGYYVSYWYYTEEPHPGRHVIDENIGRTICLAALEVVRHRDQTATKPKNIPEITGT